MISALLRILLHERKYGLQNQYFYYIFVVARLSESLISRVAMWKQLYLNQ
jgi:hypothetical protein